MKEKKKYYRYEHKTENSDIFVLREKILYSANRNCFETEIEATEHFNESKKIALKKYDDIINGINKLKEKLGDFSYSYFMEGDTYGIYNDGLYIEFIVNGYNFTFSQQN